MSGSEPSLFNPMGYALDFVRTFDRRRNPLMSRFQPLVEGMVP